MNIEKLRRKDVLTLLNMPSTTLADWINSGCPRNADQSYSIVAIVDWLAAERRSLMKMKGRERGKTSATGMTSDRALKVYRIERAKAARLDRLRIEGELVARDQAVAWVEQLVTEAKTNLLAIPRRVAPDVAGKEPRDVEAILSSEIKAALRRMSDEQKKRKAKA